MSQDGFFGSLKRVLAGKHLAPLPASPAETLYHQILQASRSVTLYQDYGVEDSIDGRFDALCLMQSVVMRRLKARSDALTALSQDLFDAMFADMDLTLREMGVGDMGVGKRVKLMSEAFMGRLTAYDAGLTAYEAGEGDAQLVAAIERNLFRDGMVKGRAADLTAAIITLSSAISALDEARILSGHLPDESLAIAPLS